MSSCFYCEDGQTRKDLMIEILKLKTSTVYLNRDQKHKGRLVLKFKDHKTEVCQLTPEENQQFFNELSVVCQAMVNLFHPDKINYGIYGDGVPHLHIHIVPKYKDGLQWGGPFKDDVPKVLLSDEEYQDLVNSYKNEITKILSK